MADKIVQHPANAPGDIPIRFKDMGDGTYALVVQATGGTFLSSTIVQQGAKDVSAQPWIVDGSAVTQPVSFSGGVDITDRIARLLGHVIVDNFPATQNIADGGGVITVDLDQFQQGTVGHQAGDFASDAEGIGLPPGYGAAGRVISIPMLYEPGADIFWRQRGDRTNGLDVDVTRVQGTVAVTGSLGRTWSLSNGTDSVNVGNFPATQITDPTDRSGRLLGHVTVDNASIPVTGTFFQTTQPVSDASLEAGIGVISDTTPGAYTALDQLAKIRRASELQNKKLDALLAVMSPAPARKSQTTLLHRSY